ncbi:MAG TPA: ABC transporter substrate-binding protein [Pseudomonas xinjiangensis]|uniref:ABC transporter substrate-binding protein n=2 Tax=root TaxID=1 RepID=A0A7V1FTF0_9GAMM|nr:ABC transporter substrate-binding protein [Halopseudomonas xinjiangensis]HEC46708.1 ABC transporter substrate-binding protein [Halopseudomonas xinjiangensis]
MLKTLIGCCALLLAVAAQADPSSGSHALTLYGEPPKYPANFDHFEYVNPQAPKGGVLRLSGFGSFDSLNGFISKGAAADRLDLLYDTLTFHSLDEPFTEYGLLAERIERADDNTWVRFHLRPQARFHDGEQVTAADVVFTFNTLIEHGAPFYRAYYADVKEVVADSDTSVTFHFHHGHNRELPLVLGQLPVLPEHYWADRDFNSSGLEHPLGNGPYRISDVRPGRSITYERVPDYWAVDLPVRRGFFNFDRVVVDYYRDTGVALEAFKAGQFDFNQEVSARNWATGYDSPALQEGRIVKEEIPNLNTQGMQGFVFNLRNPHFQDRRVRQAISLLFDFEWANGRLFHDAYTRSASFFANSELAAEGSPGKEELQLLEPLRDQLPEAVFGPAYIPPETDGTGNIREQMRQAYALLQEAGWHIEDDQLINEKGEPLSFEFLLVQADFERVLLPFKRNLASLGINMDLRRIDVSQYINRLRSRDFDMVVSGFGQSNSPGNEQREYWHSSSADNPGSRNIMGLMDPAVDTLVDGLIQAETRESLITHTRALDRVLRAGHYLVPNFYTDVYRVAYWDKFEHPEISPRYDLGLFTWWVDQSKPDAPVVPLPVAESEQQINTAEQGQPEETAGTKAVEEADGRPSANLVLSQPETSTLQPWQFWTLLTAVALGLSMLMRPRRR